MIYRRTFEMETRGSRKIGDLRPKLSDELPQGLNLRVHSYNETEGTCVVEVWCSNHEILPIEHRKNLEDLKQLDSLSFTRKVLEKSPRSDLKFSLSVSKYVDESSSVKDVDAKNKTLTFREKKNLQWIRSKKSKDTAGRNIEEFILDEG